jgi:endoglucanase
MQLSRKGVATGLVSVPLRYMHTPGEVLSLKDLDAACDLLVEFIGLLREDMNFIPG